MVLKFKKIILLKIGEKKEKEFLLSLEITPISQIIKIRGYPEAWLGYNDINLPYFDPHPRP